MDTVDRILQEAAGIAGTRSRRVRGRLAAPARPDLTERFGPLARAVPTPLLLVDERSIVRLANAAAEGLFAAPPGALDGRPLAGLLPGEDRACRLDGHELRVHATSQLVDAGADDRLWCVTVDDDASPERIRTLEQSNASLEHFASVASHDLQAPLRVIAGFIELLSRRYAGQLDAAADEYIQMTLTGVHRMQALVNDLLTYARVAKGSARDHGPVPMGAVVRDILELFHEDIARSGTVIHVDALPTVRGVRTQLQQLLQNLVANAMKYTDADGPVVWIAARPDGDRWRIEVQDNGIGIPPEQRERVFEMFQRLHPMEDYPGTGIGLAICRRIVEQHGGRIRADGGPDGGTVISFTLPAADGGGPA